MEKIINQVNDIVWSNALILLCMGGGIYFSVVTRFVQVRYFREMLLIALAGKVIGKGGKLFSGICHSCCRAGRYGNIAGVATAIAIGGPGAVFWMWMIAFLGSASAFIEATLGQIYKQVTNGEIGWAFFYIEKGLGIKWYAVVFSVATILSTGFLLPGVQSNGIAMTCRRHFQYHLPGQERW